MLRNEKWNVAILFCGLAIFIFGCSFVGELECGLCCAAFLARRQGPLARLLALLCCFFFFVSFLLKLLEEEGGTSCCVWAVRGVIYFRSLAALGCGGSVCSFSDFRGRIQIGEERAALRSISDRFFFFCSVFVCFFLGGFVF